jgi:hypothetical protein
LSANATSLFLIHKIVTAGILAVGAFLNIASLFVGMDAIAATFFTTTGELVLTTWFFLAFVLGVASELIVPVENRAVRVVRRIITVYMLMLTLAHGINNLLLDNAALYAKIFSGPFYTYPAIVLLCGLSFFVAVQPAPSERPHRLATSQN